VKVCPTSAEALKLLGISYDRSGRFLDALKTYMKALRFSPDDIALRNNLGQAYFNIGSYREAIKAFQQALHLDPNDAMAHYWLGLVYLDLNDKKMASEEQLTLAELDVQLADQLMDKIRGF
jgi:Flp pilus assembly protein TadD